MTFDRLGQYYLIRCYPNEAYRTAFNTGEKIYLNSSEYFLNLENRFQQDDEGVVFRQEPNTTGMFFQTDDYTEQDLINKGIFQIKDGKKIINPDVQLNDLKDVLLTHSSISFQTEDMILSVPFYMCCFYLIPKSDLIIDEEGFYFRNDNVISSFYNFMNQYAQEQGGYAFASIYDAQKLVSTLHQILHPKGYLMGYGPVQYEDVPQENRLNNFQKNNLDGLLLTKPTKYAYQHEFRIIIRPSHNQMHDHIEEKGQDLHNAICQDFAYLTPDYVKRMKNHEI